MRGRRAGSAAPCRLFSALRPAACCLLRGGGLSCGGGARRSRGQPEPGRRGVGAAPSATQRPRPGAHGDAGERARRARPLGRPRFVRNGWDDLPSLPPTPDTAALGGEQQLPSLQLSDHHAPGAAPSSLSPATLTAFRASAPHPRCSERGHGKSPGKLTSRTRCHRVITANGAGFWKKTRYPALEMSQRCLPNLISPLQAHFSSPDLPAGSSHYHTSFRDNHALCQHSALHLLGESNSARAATEHQQT